MRVHVVQFSRNPFDLTGVVALADPLRLDRLLPARLEGRPEAAARRLARRGGDADVVAGRDRLVERAREPALARHARAARRGAGAVRGRDRADHGRRAASSARYALVATLAWGRCSSTSRSRSCTRSRSPSRCRRCVARDRDARARDGLDLRALPRRVQPRHRAAVPGLDRDRAARAALGAARLGRQDRLVPRPVLGLPRDQGGDARRRSPWPTIGMCVVVSAAYFASARSASTTSCASRARAASLKLT